MTRDCDTSGVGPPPVVLVPGLLCDERIWSRVVPALTGPSIVVDLTSAGTLEAMAHIILHTAPKRFILAGFSMGGMAALLAATQAPERIAGLVLVATHAGSETPDRKADRARQIMDAMNGGFDDIVERSLQPSYFAHLSSQVLAPERALVRRMAADQGVAMFRRHGLALMARPDLHAEIPQLRFPVVVVAGSEDRLVPTDRSRLVAELAVDGRFHLLAGCGHMVPLEQPAAVSRHINALAELRVGDLA